jgi:hypothetical protein
MVSFTRGARAAVDEVTRVAEKTAQTAADVNSDIASRISDNLKEFNSAFKAITNTVGMGAAIAEMFGIDTGRTIERISSARKRLNQREATIQAYEEEALRLTSKEERDKLFNAAIQDLMRRKALEAQRRADAVVSTQTPSPERTPRRRRRSGKYRIRRD